MRAHARLAAVLALTITLTLLASVITTSTALASVPTDRFDSRAFYDGISYVTRNPNAPTPSLPWANGGTGDVLETVGCHILEDGTFESDASSHNNGAAGMRVTVRFPSQGIYHDSITDEEIVVDIYDTFEVIQSIGSTENHVHWYPGGSEKSGQLFIDGWWITYAPFYKDTYVFKRAGTNEIIPLHSIGYTERSMNAGEGFAVVGAVRGYVTDDMPGWAAPTSDGQYFKSSHIPGTNVLNADIEGRGAHGFIGALSTSVGPDHTVTNQIGPRVQYASGPIIGEYLSGTDASGVVRSTIDGVVYDDTSMWMGASVVGTASTNSVQVYGIKLEFDGAGYLADGWNGITTPFFADADRLGGAYTSTTEWWNSYVGRWYVPSFAPFTATTPEKPTKSVDKTTAYGTETLRYTITQRVANEGIDSAFGYTYSEMLFSDTLDPSLDYNRDLRVTDTHGNDVTARGTTSVSGQTVSWRASTELLDTLDYNGGLMTFSFTASTARIADDWQYSNQASMRINNQTQLTNRIDTLLLSGPLPKVIKHDADNRTTTPQGDATTQGALYAVRYWFAARTTTECATRQPNRTWRFQTDSTGTLSMDAAHKVSGDALWTMNGNVVAPLHGFISVVEERAPTGYRLPSPAPTYWYDLG